MGEESPEQVILSAKAAAERGDHGVAAIKLKAALQRSADSAELRLLLGKSLLAAGDPRAAHVELTKALVLGAAPAAAAPPLARALLLTGGAPKVVDQYASMRFEGHKEATADLRTTLAVAYGIVGQHELRLQSLAEALDAVPTHAPALLQKAALALIAGEFSAAMELLDGVLIRDPRNAEALLLRGEALYHLKRDEAGAIESLRAALHARPDYYAAHSALMTLFLRKPDIAAATAQLESMRKVRARPLLIRYYEAQIAYLQKQHRKVREIGLQLLKTVPDHTATLYLMGANEFQFGAVVQAQSHLAKLVALDPSHEGARKLLAQTHLRQGQGAAAIALLTPHADAGRADSDMLTSLAEAHLLEGSPQKSHLYFERAAKANPQDPKIKTAIALSMIARGKVEAGFAELESVAATDKTTLADLALLSTRIRRGETDAALAALDRLDKKRPSYALAAHMRGKLLQVKRDPVGARASFERALTLDPAFFPSAASLAAMDLQEKDSASARKRFETMLAHDPSSYQAQLAIAGLLIQQSAPKNEVIERIRAAIRTNPVEPAPRMLLIEYLREVKDDKAALGAAQDAVAALPDHPMLQLVLGELESAAGNPRQAVGAVTKAAMLNPKSVRPHIVLADIHIGLKDFGSAQRNLSKALEIAPSYVPAIQRVIMLAVQSGESDRALRAARGLQRERPRLPVGYLFEGDLHYELKKWDQAAVAYRKAFDLRRDSENLVRLHRVLIFAGRVAEADKLASAWLSEQPKDSSFLAYAGDVAMRRGDVAHAERLYRESLAADPDNVLALNNLAYVLIRRSDRESVLHAERANRLMPNRPGLMDTLAMALSIDGQSARAIELQKKAVDRMPDFHALRLNLAKIYVKAGEREKARAELERLQYIGPSFAGHAEVAKMLGTL